MKENVFDILDRRGFIKQTVYKDELYKLLGSQSVTFYCGFDPTADSLHIGHFIPLMMASIMQKAGHKPIILVGGGTAMVGDPSNRNDMRQMMTKETIADNVAKIRPQLERFVSFEGKNAAVIVNNADWLCKLNYIDFLRDYGAFLSVNKMLTADCFKTRLEKGLSFLEFNYMPMQAYDFLRLYEDYGCVLEVGGNDQWSNILAGADFIRRTLRKDAYALTCSLLETKDGKKMGKTQKGALWLDRNKTTPYEMYQYFRNVGDEEVENCLRLLTYVELGEIKELCAHRDERINNAKKRLAYEVVKLIHGEKDAIEAQSQAQAAFEGANTEMPTVEISANGDTGLLDMMVACKVCASKGEARRLIEGGGVKIDDKKVDNVTGKVSDYTSNKEFVLSKGKKTKLKVVLK
ncbi:MAG: tyrosine--tRNA ligase [Clostridiales bacterium]|nr:tyrosine--tRNA ligase [Clostridiales bacterium]